MVLFSFSGPQNAQLQTTDDGSESTDIPSAQARWEEESNALDGQAAHLCIASLSDRIIQTLTQTYEQENAPKDPPRPAPVSTANAQASSSTLRAEESGTQGGGSQGEINRGPPNAPHPSDQVTPSNPSPRDSVSTVDQLRSSLRQVADALAQTVAAVRNTRELLSGGGSGENAPEGGQEGEGELGDRDQQPMESNHHDTDVPSVPEVGTVAQEESSSMETSELPRIQVSLPPPSSHSPPPPLPPPQSTQPTSSPSPTSPPATLTTSYASTTTTLSASPTPSNPIMATFDGSQASAVATLASTSPEDPLYTFLSAVAGAPAPPLPESSPLSSPVQQTSQPTATSPRLPVFAQFQSSSGSTIPSSSSSNTVEPSHSHSTAIPMSVIQDARTSMVSIPPPPSSATSGVSTTEPQVPSITDSVPPTESSREADVDVSVLAANIVSQVNTTLQQTSDGNATSGNASGLVQAASIADSLAQELVRAVSHLVPTTSSSNGSSTSERVPTTTTVATLAATTNTQSPSPSDTLAPLLISSLQLPPSSGASRTEPLAEPADADQQGPTGQEQPIAMEASVRDEKTGEVSPMQTEGTMVASGQSDAETGQSSAAAAGGGEGGGTPSVLTQDAIDPTFLAALPDPIRDEVLAQHEREQQLRRVQRESGLPSSISPEFLAALPTSIQEEVGTKFVTVSVYSVYMMHFCLSRIVCIMHFCLSRIVYIM